MKYVKLQNTGLEVSKICVGCMNLGAKDKYPWHLDKQEGIEYIKHAFVINPFSFNFLISSNIDTFTFIEYLFPKNELVSKSIYSLLNLSPFKEYLNGFHTNILL